MHITAVGSNGDKNAIPVIHGLKRAKEAVTANLTDDEVAAVQAEAENAPFLAGNIIKKDCVLKPWQTSAYIILDCGKVATADDTLADYCYTGARKGISPVREATLELRSGGAQYISADSHTSASNETYVGDTKVVFRGGRSGYGEVGIRLTNHCMMVGNLTFEIHEDDAAMPTYTPWIQPVMNSSLANTKLFGDYHFLMTGGTVGKNATSGANGYYGAIQATGKVVNEIRGGQLWVFATVRYGGEFAEETPISTVLPGTGETLTAKVAVHNIVTGGTFGGVDGTGAVVSNTGFYAGSYDGDDANVPPSVCNEITGGTFYRFAASNKTRSNNFNSHIYNFVSGTEEAYPTFRCNFYGAYATRTTKEVTNVIKGYPRFIKEDGTKTWVYGGCELGTVEKVTNYLGGMPVFDDFYGGSSGAAPTYEADGKTVKANNNAITKNIENHIALDPTEKGISSYVWGGNGYYGASGQNSRNSVTESLVSNVYSGTYGTLRAESSTGTDKCDIVLNVYGGTWKSNFMAVNRTYDKTSSAVKDYTVTTNIYDGIFEANMYMGGQNSRNQAIVNNVYGGRFATKYVSGDKTTGGYGYYGTGDSYCLSVENNIYGGTFTGPYYGGGRDGADEFIKNNLYGGLFGDQHEYMGAENSINGACPIINHFYGGDSGANWIYCGHKAGPATTIENNFLSGKENPVRDPENALYKYFDKDGTTTLEGGFRFRDQVIAGSGYSESTYLSTTAEGITNTLEGGCWTKEGGSTTYITLHGGMRWGIVNGDVVNNVITGKYYRIYSGSDYGMINGTITNNYGKELAEGEEAPELAFYNNGDSIGYIFGGGYDNVDFPAKVKAALDAQAALEEGKTLTAAQQTYVDIAATLEEGQVYNCTTGAITNNIYYGSFKQFFGGSYGLLTEGVTSNIASITNNIYGGTFTDTKLTNGNTEHAYYGGCLRNCNIAGGITNNIYGGSFQTNYYGGTPGNGVVVCPTVTNNFYGGVGSTSGNKQFFMGNGSALFTGTIKNTFYAAGEFGPGFVANRSYVFGGSAGTHTNTEAEFAVVSEIYGGTFSGFWGVGGGTSTKLNGNVKTTVYGGTFNGYSSTMPNSIAGGPRNGTLVGDIELTINGGTFTADVVGGTIYGSYPSAAKKIDGDITLTIQGGDFQRNIYAICKTAGEITCTGDATLNVVQTAGKALKFGGVASIDSFIANGEAINIGADTNITIDALTGTIALKQMEGWQAHDYLSIPAGSLYTIDQAAGVYGAHIADDTILVKGIAVLPVGATIRLAERLGVRIVLNADDVDAYGEVFTYVVKLGDTVLAEGDYDTIKANQYSILFDGIGLNKFDEKFVVTSPLMEDISYSIVDLAGIAQTAWADNARWKGYADAIIEFHNVYNLDAENTMIPEEVTTQVKIEKGELGDSIVENGATATLLMSDAAGVRVTVELTETPASAKVVVAGKEFDTKIEGNKISADVFFAHESLTDEFEISVQNGDGQVYMTYTASIEAMANELATNEENQNKDNAQAFLVYIQKAVACK